MPPAIAAAIAAAIAEAGTLAYAIAYAVTYAITSLAIGMAVSFVTSALMGGGKSGRAPGGASTADAGDRTQMVRQAISYWRWLVGECMVSGPITFLHTTGSTNDKLHVVATIACHPVAEIGEIYFDDELVTFDGEEASGKYAGYAKLWRGLGTRTGDADLLAALRENCPEKIGANWRQSRRAKFYAELTYSADLYSSGTPNIKVLCKGRLVLDPRQPVLDLTWEAGEPGVFTTLSEGVEVEHGLAAGDMVHVTGTDLDESYDYEVGTVPTATTLTLVDQCYADVAMIEAGSAGTLSRLAWDPNAVLVVRAYVRDPQTGLAAPDAELGDDDNIASANVADEQVTVMIARAVTLNADADRVTLASACTGMRAGDEVRFATSGSLSDTGLDAGTSYYWIQVSDTIGQVAASADDATAEEPVAVDITGEGSGTHTLTRCGSRTFSAAAAAAVTDSSHAGWETGDLVQVSATVLPEPLAAGTNYWLIKLADSRWRFAASADDADDAVSIILTSEGEGVVVTNYSHPSVSVQYVDNGDGTMGTIETTDYPTDTVTCATGADGVALESALPYLSTGDGVEVTTDDTLPDGLAAETTYYWRRSLAAEGLLCASYADALAGIGITMADSGSGTHTLLRVSEPRYVCHGTFESDATPKDIAAKLLSPCVGQLVFSGGLWSILAAYWRTPTRAAIGYDDLDGPIRLASRRSRRDLFNAVKGTFIDPESDWQETDGPAVTNALYLAEDNGERLWKNVDLPFTISPSAFQRIEKIDLERCRQQQSLSLSCKLTAMDIRAGDVVPVTLSRFGFTAKPFEVERWTFEIRQDPDDNPYLGIALELRETASGVYDWHAGEETLVDPSPDTDLPKPFDIAPPTNLVLASGDDEMLLAGDGTLVTRILATWTQPAYAYVSQIEGQFKQSAATAWADLAPMPADQTATWISPVEDGVAYDVRIRARNPLGPASDWAEVIHYTVIGKSAVPGPADTFIVSELPDGTRRFSWTQAAVPADVRTGGGWRILYHSGVTADLSAMYPLHTGKLTASPYECNAMAAGTWTFALVTVDSSGNQSAPLFIQAELGDPRLLGVLPGSRLEHDLGFPGTLTDCFVDSDGVLRAASDGTWADLPDTWSALPDSWATILPARSPIVYETPVVDLSADVSFTPLITVTGRGSATIECRFGTSADGTVTGSYAAPANQTGKRYAQVRVTVADATEPTIETLAVVFDGRVVSEQFSDVDTATCAEPWFERLGTGHFRVGSRSGDVAVVSAATVIAFQSTQPGWTQALGSKAVTVNGQPGAEFRIFLAGVAADCVVDIEMKGPKAT